MLISLGSFTVLYATLLLFALIFGARIIRQGPELSLEPPTGAVRAASSAT